MKPSKLRFFVLFSFLLLPSVSSRFTFAERPNIILILADDLGYGDLVCYGQKILKTPHLDRMAKEGMRFTQHYAGSTVCAPSRCVLLTGLHTGHCRVRGNGPGQLTEQDVTFASILQKSGYRTACFGKWGIGNPPPLDDPQKHGFDQFYGYINMFHAHNYYPEFLIRNGRKESLGNELYPEWKEKRTGAREGAGVAKVARDYAPELISTAMRTFIRQHHSLRQKKRTTQPFFVYYALNIPHANNEGGSEPRIGRNGMRVPSWGEFARLDWPDQEKGFASMIHNIDQDVGKLFDLLKELKIDEQTIVMFTSDNGPHQEGGHKVSTFQSGGKLRGWKRDLYEGGIRVPMIVRWPNHIPPGIESGHISGFQDLFPTVLELAQVKEIPQTDGMSFVSTLYNRETVQQEHLFLYWEFLEQGGKQAILQGRWKGVRKQTLKNPNGPLELFDLQTDPAEQNDISAQHPEKVKQMKQWMKDSHRENK